MGFRNMRQNKSIVRNTILAALAVAGVVVYVLWPTPLRTFSLWPRSFPPNVLVPFEKIDPGEHSQMSMQTTRDSLLQLDWVQDSIENLDHRVGIRWELSNQNNEYLNWMRFDSLHLEIRSKGAKEILLKILTHDPDFTTPTVADSWRVLTKEVMVDSTWTKLSIPIEYFYVPEWWYIKHRVPKDFSQKHFSAVHAFELGPNHTLVENKGFLQVRSAHLSGSSNRPFAVLFFYLFIVLIVALGTNPQGKRSSRP